MALTPSRIIIAEDATGTAFKSFTDTQANHAQAVALVDASGNQLGVPGYPMRVMSYNYMSGGISEGLVYSIQDTITVPNNGIRNYGITMPDSTTRIFFKFSFELQNAFAVSFFEGSTFTGGTASVGRNHNRNSANVSILNVVIDPTITADGTRLAYSLFDASGTAQSWDLPKGEWILRNATQYVLRFDNDSNAGIVRFAAWWIELPPAIANP